MTVADCDVCGYQSFDLKPISGRYLCNRCFLASIKSPTHRLLAGDSTALPKPVQGESANRVSTSLFKRITYA